MSFATDPGRASLFSRVRAILLRPTAEWGLIAAEPATVAGLFRSYAVPLAAIGPVCTVIGKLVFGSGVPGIAVYRPNPVGLILAELLAYGLALGSVFVLGLVIEALATSFDGVKDRVGAMKVAVYSSTASWLAAALNLVPVLGIVGLLVSLYGLYLLYRGLPIVMRAPHSKALGYTAVTVLVDIVLAVVAGLVLAPLLLMGAATGAATGAITTY